MRLVPVKDNQQRLITVCVPTREDVLNLKIGDVAPNCFSESIVTDIFATGEDFKGRAYVCYYTDFGNGSKLSHSVKEGELVRTIHLCNHYTSKELDSLEKRVA